MLATGCAGTKLPASVSGGIDQIFPAPPHEIRGATKVDQDWIDETIAAGQTCCHWEIEPRPAELDRPAKVVVAPAPVQKKPSLWRRLIRKKQTS